jgi:glucose-6-phosphate isomerase
VTLSITEITPAAIGRLIALFERAVGLYATLTGINAYHQPGVEAGKKAASAVLEVRKLIIRYLNANQGTGKSATQIADEIGQQEKIGWVYKILESLVINQPNIFERKSGESTLEDLFLAS